MNVGILGTGGIVKSIAPTLAKMEGMYCYAIASRTRERGKEAASEFGFEKGYGSYEELLADEAVELVYIATPHSRHFEDMKLCLRYGKPVLCEKAFTLNAKQAREIKALAEKEKIYVAEAIWPRYMPSRSIIQDIVDSGIVGEIKTLTANLSYPIAHVERLVAPALAGGALLDIGVYGLNFAFMHFGTEIVRIDSSVQFTETGVDGSESITIHYKDGRMAVLTHSIYGRSDRAGIFYGEKGYIVVENINNPSAVSVYDTEDRLIKKVEMPAQISGYEYQFAEALERIKKGEWQSVSMPLDDSIFVLEQMDRLRKDWGLTYPQEKS